MPIELETPVSENAVRKLKIGDVVYVTGTLVTLRDRALTRLMRLNKSETPTPLDGSAIFHCGPLLKKVRSRWEVIVAGPTTSMRMEKLQGDVIRKFGVRVVIGKGGMGDKTTEAMRKYGAVYAAFTGGAAVLAAEAIKSVKDVKWLDLGMPEALWVFEVERFGPCLVAIDSHGNNLYNSVVEKAKSRKVA